MLVVKVVIAVFAALFVTAWLYCRWLDYREAHPGSVRAVRLRLSIEKSEHLEEGLCAVAHVDFHNRGRHAIKLSGKTQLLVNGKRPSNKMGYQTTDFFNVIAPAGGIATLEVVATRITVLSNNRIEGALFYDFKYEISEKRAQTGQQTAGRIAYQGKLGAQVVGPANIEFEVGPDAHDQYR